MADTRSKSLFAEALVREVDETFGSGIDKLKETIADQNAKIGERIHALLLLLRSRNTEEENMQVNALSASPQGPELSESPDFDRPEPKLNTVINVTPDVPKTSSPLSTFTYKLHRRISFEEVDERRLKGLCLFCDESETPDHYLQHENSGICIMDNDEDLFLSDSDLVENEVEKDSVEIDVEMSSDEDQFSDAVEVYGFNVEACETDSLIEQNQLIQEEDENHSTDSVLKYSLVQHMCSPLKHQSLFDLGIATSNARQVFATIPLRREILSEGHKKTFHKSWRFKFKHRGETNYNGVRIKKWCSRFQNVGSAEAGWLEGTWFFNSTGTQAKNYADGKLHYPYMVLHKRLIRSHKIQQRRKMALYPKSWMFKYKRGHKKLHTPTLSKNLRNFHVDHFSHKDIESPEEKQSSRQVIFVDVESLVQQQELNCDRAFVLVMDHGGSSPYAKSETGWFVKTDSISEFESESTDSKMETDSVAHLQVSKNFMESSHQHKLLGNFDMHMVIEDQQPVVALSPLFDAFHSDMAEFCEQSTCDKSHKQKQRLSPKSWMFKFKTSSNPNGTSHLSCHNKSGLLCTNPWSQEAVQTSCAQIQKKKKKSVCFVLVPVKLRYQSW